MVKRGSYKAHFSAGVTEQKPKPELTPTMSETIKNKLSGCAHQWGESWLYQSGKCCLQCGASIKMYEHFIKGVRKEIA